MHSGVRRILMLLLVSSCSHSAPLEPAKYTPNGPFRTDIPRQLTFSVGRDQTPAWRNDGSAIVYSYDRTDRAGNDRCLGILPAEGGTRLGSLCNVTRASEDSIDGFEDPTLGPNDTLAYFRTSAPLGSVTPILSWVEIGSFLSGTTPRVVHAFPFRAPSGQIHDKPVSLTWLGSAALAYVGARVDYSRPCQGCPLDTIVTGLEIATLNLSQPTAVVTPLPGTDYASSLDAEAGGGSLVFTVGGDPRVYRRDMTTGAATVVHDFGTLGIARDVRISGSRLVAVVGGRVSFGLDPSLGTVQRDEGGHLYAVDLQSDQESELSIPEHLFRRPAISGSGTRIVAESYRLILTDIRDPVSGGLIGVDTFVVKAGDLYLFDSP